MRVLYTAGESGKISEMDADALEGIALEETQLVTRDPTTNVYRLGRAGSMRELVAHHKLAALAAGTLVLLCACSSGEVDTDTTSTTSSSGDIPDASDDAPCSGACPVDVPPDVDMSGCRITLCSPETAACDTYAYFPGVSCNSGRGVCDDAGSCVVK